MTTLPGHWVKTVEHHEWYIAKSTDAKTLHLSLHAIERDMEEMGMDTTCDDCYRVEGQEDGRIKVWFEVDLGTSGYRSPDLGRD